RCRRRSRTGSERLLKRSIAFMVPFIRLDEYLFLRACKNSVTTALHHDHVMGLKAQTRRTAMVDDVPIPPPEMNENLVTLSGILLYGGIILACIIIAIVYKVREKKKRQERGDRW